MLPNLMNDESGGSGNRSDENNLTADEIISKSRKASIRREFPDVLILPGAWL
jgi:hypothetical protein